MGRTTHISSQEDLQLARGKRFAGISVHASASNSYTSVGGIGVLRHGSSNSSAAFGRNCLLVTNRDGEILFASANGRVWLRKFFGRPMGPRMLPNKIVRWLAGDGVRAGRGSLVGKSRNARLFVRRYKPQSNDAIALLLQMVVGRAAAPSRKCGLLTPREKDVLQWIAAGKSNSEIGMILGLSPRTVEKHLERMFMKLGVENRTSAASFYGVAIDAKTERKSSARVDRRARAN